MKTYSAKSSAIRAARKFYKDNNYADHCEIHNRLDGWYFTDLVSEEEPVVVLEEPVIPTPPKAKAKTTTSVNVPKRAGSIGVKIWNTCFSNPGMTRVDFIEVCVKMGISPGSASTGYSDFNRAAKAGHEWKII